ncbi:MAG: succinate dehydrogenase assembly factor 2 [Parvularculaceae bacterium]|nr:succinate dehydrogenase assembly factor 2 [Parvularculaceae bacterium]
MSLEPDDLRRKKLLHRARYRGFKEADLLVGGFADEALPDMSAAELDAFEAILSLNDHDIYAWVFGGAAPPANVDAALIARMRAFDASKRA